MPDQAYRSTQLTRAQADARRHLADRALAGATTDELRVLVDKLDEIARVSPPPVFEIDTRVTAFGEA
jgi:hypothetical protein